jgi:hypothetical protein
VLEASDASDRLISRPRCRGCADAACGLAQARQHSAARADGTRAEARAPPTALWHCDYWEKAVPPKGAVAFSTAEGERVASVERLTEEHEEMAAPNKRRSWRREFRSAAR